jgi:SAM-dependent methyltransferase
MAQGQQTSEAWAVGAAYEPYVGRWSRLVAREFLAWIHVPRGGEWLDVGCGTGALSGAILGSAAPRNVLGIDRSEDFVVHARAHVPDPRARFEVGDAAALPVPNDAFDATVSGLVLNFVPEPARMVAEMARVSRHGGTVALYVWDYAGGMELIRFFWDAAKELDPRSAALDEGVRFPICAPAPLTALFAAAGLSGVETCAIEVATRFHDFDDYWSPFLGGQGPAPAYTMSLPEERRTALRDAVRAALPIASDGSMALTARAWAVRGHRVASRGEWAPPEVAAHSGRGHAPPRLDAMETEAAARGILPCEERVAARAQETRQAGPARTRRARHARVQPARSRGRAPGAGGGHRHRGPRGRHLQELPPAAGSRAQRQNDSSACTGPRYRMAPKTFRMSLLDCPSGSLRMARSSSASMA